MHEDVEVVEEDVEEEEEEKEFPNVLVWVGMSTHYL